MGFSTENESTKSRREIDTGLYNFHTIFIYSSFFLTLISGLIPLLCRPYNTTSMFQKFSQAEREYVS
jgi:hypothetical protein